MNSPSKQDRRMRVWDRLQTTTPPVFVQSIRIVQSDVFAQQEIDFSPATVILGSHGTGKTVFLRLLEAVFGEWRMGNDPPFCGGSIEDNNGFEPVVGIVEVIMSVGDSRIVRTVDLSLKEEERQHIWSGKIPEPYRAMFVSSARFASGWNFYFQEIAYEVKDKPEGGERVYKAKELSALRNILGRNYESAAVKTVLLDDDLPHPYVVAKINGKNLNTTQLSLGKFWVHQVFWEQDRLSPGCLLLLDEPESFLSALGHRPFIDEVARRCLDRKLQLVVASHSPDVLSRFPLRDIRMCVNNAEGKILVIRPENLAQVRRSVGIEIQTKTIVLVEDHFAVNLLQTIFAQLNVPMGTIEVIAVGGESEVIAGARLLIGLQRMHCFGVLDADQKNQLGGAKNLRALPGHQVPESELLTVALSKMSDVALALGRSPEALQVALHNCRSLDHQYQLQEFSENLGFSQEYVINILASVWLRSPDIRDEAMTLVSDLLEE
jgi:hypothetical protein